MRPGRSTIFTVSSKSGRLVAICLLVAAFATVLALTLWPTHVDGSARSGFEWFSERLANRGIHLPFGYGFVEFVLNIVLFVPPAAILAYLLNGRHTAWVILTGVAVSLFVEMVQLRVLDGRTATVQDVLANSLGAAVGAVVVAVWLAFRRRTSERVAHPLGHSARHSEPARVQNPLRRPSGRK